MDSCIDTDAIARNIELALTAVSRAGGRRHVALVAATKTVPARVIARLPEWGIFDAGENRVQEYLDKRDAFSGVTRHFIGTLQRNKAKYLVGDVALIQSVSSAETAETIDALAVKKSIVQDVLIEVNIADETSKTGVSTADAERLIERARALSNVRVRGLMAIPPRDAGDNVYERLYRLYSRYAGGCFDTLSVGMSGDYERAIAHGSNMVRLGTALFGQRQQ